MSVRRAREGRAPVRAAGGVEALALPVRIRRRRWRADAGDARVGAPVAGPRRCSRGSRSTRSRRSGRRCAPSRPTFRCGWASSTSSTTAGTYTTNGPIKRANRRNEQALRAAELWSVGGGGARRLERVSRPSRSTRRGSCCCSTSSTTSSPARAFTGPTKTASATTRGSRELTADLDRHRAAGDRRAGRHHAHDATGRGVQRRVARPSRARADRHRRRARARVRRGSRVRVLDDRLEAARRPSAARR